MQVKALVVEISDKAIRRTSDIFGIVDSKLIVSIPYIITAAEVRCAKASRDFAGALFGCSFGGRGDRSLLFLAACRARSVDRESAGWFVPLNRSSRRTRVDSIKQAVELARAAEVAPGHTVPLHPAISEGSRSRLPSAQIRDVRLHAVHLEKSRIVAHGQSGAHGRYYDMLRTQVLQEMDKKGWQFFGRDIADRRWR